MNSLRHLILFHLLLFCTARAGAEELSVPSMTSHPLPEVLVTATRSAADTFRVPQFASIVPSEEIERRIPSTTPDLLDRQAGILVQKTNLGGGSVFIRGVTGKQILLLVDGVRLNNSLYRFGPHQYLNTIDPHTIERLEVVRGPMSVLYGSDAMGGTINVITHRCREFGLSSDVGGRLYGKYGSAATERAGRLELEANVGNAGALFGGTYRAFGDLTAGGGVGLQAPTGYDEVDADMKMNWKPSTSHEWTVATQFVRQYRVPKTSEVTLGGKLKYDYEPQRRLLAYLRFEGTELAGKWLGLARVTLSYNLQEEGEEVVRDDPDIETKEENGANTLGATLLLRSDLGAFGVLSYGAEFYQDWISSTRHTFSYRSGESRQVRSAFPDGATYRTVGLYVQDEIPILDRLTLLVGGRYSYVKTEGELKDPEGGRQDTLSLETDNLSGMAHIQLEVFPWLNGVFGVAQGYRAPNMEDFFGKVDFVEEIPNTALTAERSINYEFGLKARHTLFSGNLFYFLSDYDDLIGRKRVDSVVQRQNIGEAGIQGVELDFRVSLPMDLILFGTYSWIQGTNRTSDEPLRRIPPMMGTVGVRYQPSARYWAEAWGLFAGRQDRLSPGDISDERIPEGGTPGYAVFNLGGGVRLWDTLDGTFWIENLGDAEYKTHGSGIYFPGINIMVGLKVAF